MTNTVSTEVIKVTADTRAASAAIRQLDQSIAKTGLTLANLGNTQGFKNVDAGAVKAASSVSQSTATMVQALEFSSAAMDAGRTSTVQFYRAIADQFNGKTSISSLSAVSIDNARALGQSASDLIEVQRTLLAVVESRGISGAQLDVPKQATANRPAVSLGCACASPSVKDVEFSPLPLSEEFLDAAKGYDKLKVNKPEVPDVKPALETLESLEEAAKSVSKSMAESFGDVGKAIGGMMIALVDYGKAQEETNDAKRLRLNVKSYGDMASAAKGFFDENSTGYKTLEKIEKAFRATEMAMALEAMTKKIFFKQTEVAASVSGNAIKASSDVTSSAVSAGAASSEASAWGVTAVVKAIASMPFPLNLAAGAATLAAVIGIGGKLSGGLGSGGDTTAADRQKANGTGSILGEPDAKSESIKKSLDAIEKNTYQDLAINSSMLTVLRSIESVISGVSNILFRTVGFTTKASSTQLGSAALAGQQLGALTPLLSKPLGELTGKISNAIFGGNVHQIDTGITLDKGSLAQLLAAGANVSQYTDTKKDGGLFHSDKYGTSLTDLGPEIDKQFTLLFGDMHDVIVQSAAVLGISGSEFNQKLDSFVVDIGKISTKDLKPDEVQTALQNALSKVSDDMAKFAVDGLTKFQNAGEGAFETLTRLASEYQTVDVVFQSFGKTFGQVGLASMEARDRLIQLAGGLDEFTSQGEYFLENFFSEQEQATALKARIEPTLKEYGLSVDGDQASKLFRDFVVGLDTTTDAGARTYTALMAIAPAFKTVVDAQKAAQEDALEERKSLQTELDELTMTSAQLRDKERAAIDASNLALYDQIRAIKDQEQAITDARDAARTLMEGVDNAFSVLQKVVAREKSALQESINQKTKTIATLQSMSEALHSTLDGTKTSEQKLADRSSAQAQLQAALAIAKASGTLPDADKLKKALSAVSQDASSQFSSYTDYLRDLYQTQSVVAGLADITDDSLSVEEASLKALDEQVKYLDGVLEAAQAQIEEAKGQSVALLSIDQAVQAINVALAQARANPIVSATPAINEAYQEVLGRAPDAAGLKFWQDAAASGQSIDAIKGSIANSAEAQVRKLYKDLLGRPADGAGLEYWLHTGASIDAIREGIKNSDEYKLKGLPAYASGGLFGGGLRIVGENGPELEATGPSRIWSSQQTASILGRAADPSANAEALAAAVQRLTETVERQAQLIAQLQDPLTQTELNTRRLATDFQRVTRSGDAMITTTG